VTALYTDSEGRQCELAVMCRREPEWASKRIKHLTEQLDRVRALLEANGCDCSCDHSAEEHYRCCERCLACRIEEAIR